MHKDNRFYIKICVSKFLSHD